jgi:hypothetical protein
MFAFECGREHHELCALLSDGGIQIVINCLTVAKGCQEIRVVSGTLRDLRVRMSLR